MNSTLKYILLSVAVLASLLFLLGMNKFSANNENRQVCSNVNIHFTNSADLQLIDAEDIARYLANNNLYPIGERFESFKTADIEKILNEHPIIKNADCYKSPKGEVVIDIHQRKPIFRVFSGENYFVDDEGELMPLATQNSVYLPIVTGKVTKTLATNELFEFVKYVRKDEFWDNQIEQIYINNQSQVQLIPRVGDHIIVLGSFDNFEKKLKRMQMFYLYGLSKVGWEAYSKIDLSFNNQVVCTKR